MGVTVTRRDSTQNWIPGANAVSNSLSGVRSTLDQLFNQNMQKATTFDDPEALRKLGISTDLTSDQQKLWDYLGGGDAGANNNQATMGTQNVSTQTGSSSPYKMSEDMAGKVKAITQLGLSPDTAARNYNIWIKDKNGNTSLYQQEATEFTKEQVGKLDRGQRSAMAEMKQLEGILGHFPSMEEYTKAKAEGRIYARQGDGVPSLVKKSIDNSVGRTEEILNTGKQPPSVYPKQSQDSIDKVRTMLAAGDNQSMKNAMDTMTGTPVQQFQSAQVPQQKSNQQIFNELASMQGNKMQKNRIVASYYNAGLITPQQAYMLDENFNANLSNQFKKNSVAGIDYQQQLAGQNRDAETAAKLQVANAYTQNRGGSVKGGSSTQQTVPGGINDLQAAKLGQAQQKIDTATAMKLAEFKQGFQTKKGKPNEAAINNYNQLAQNVGFKEYWYSDGDNIQMADLSTPEGQLYRLVYNAKGPNGFKNGQVKKDLVQEFMPQVQSMFGGQVQTQQPQPAQIAQPVQVTQAKKNLAAVQKELEARK